MKISKSGLDLIKEFEGLELRSYVCPAGYKTIGYGHKLLPFEIKAFSCGITEETAHYLLLDDVVKAENAVNRLISVWLHQNQFDALVSWTFNLGFGNLRTSEMRELLNKGDYDSVPDQMRRWKYCNGDYKNPNRGLVRRRDAEAVLFGGGE